MFECLTVTDDQLLDQLLADERLIRAAQARQLVTIDELARRASGWMLPGAAQAGLLDPIELAAAEIGPALRLSRVAATDRIGLAQTVCTRLAGTLGALAAGEVDLTRVRVLADATMPLTDSDAREVEERVLPRAGLLTASALRPICARAVLAVDPGAGQRRHEQAVRHDRSVRVFPDADGMAVLWARLAAAEAAACHQSLTRLADDARTRGDARSADARRADTLVDLLTGSRLGAPGGRRIGGADGGGGSGAYESPRRAGRSAAEIRVTVDWRTLAGFDDHPAHLHGHGPITATTARDIAGGDATWRRILTDPGSGTVMDVGRTRYTPPVALAEVVRARDDVCRFPGCRQPATRADLDHTEPYPGGRTAADNLAALCRTHHRIKTHSRWQVRQNWLGSLIWISPTGQRYSTQSWQLDPDAPDPPVVDDTGDPGS